MSNDTQYEEHLKESLTRKFGDQITEVKIPRARRVYVTFDRDQLVPIVTFLKETEGLRYLSTITPCDAGERYEILYHFNLKDSAVVTLRALVPKDQFEPTIASITPLIPGATFYEREVYDLLGVAATGHPNLARISLPESHPDHDHPLRKDWKPVPYDKDAIWRGEPDGNS